MSVRCVLPKHWKWTRHWLCLVWEVSKIVVCVVCSKHFVTRKWNLWRWCETYCRHVESEHHIDFTLVWLWVEYCVFVCDCENRFSRLKTTASSVSGQHVLLRRWTSTQPWLHCRCTVSEECRLFVFSAQYFCLLLLITMFKIDNEFDHEGSKAIAKMLKVNQR